jgi:hypothetical protein
MRDVWNARRSAIHRFLIRRSPPMKTSLRIRVIAALAAFLVGIADRASAQDIAFNVASTFSVLHTMDAHTEPISLQVLLGAPVQGATFVQIASSDPAIAVVTGGGAYIQEGQVSSTVLLSGLNLGTTTLTAMLGNAHSTALVSVVSEIPAVPEAGTASLLAAGGAMVCLIARRRRMESAYN